MLSYHIARRDPWSGLLQPAFCGSHSPNLIAFDLVRDLIATGSVEQDEVCSECWMEFELRQKADA
jgi:hypothetical protein